jgi:biopolymer transport protein ExbB
MPIVTYTKSIMLSAGAAPVLWIMFALSVLSVAIMLERAWTFFRASDDVDALARDLRVYLAANDLAGAHARMEASRGAEAAVLAAGLSHAGRGPRAAEQAMTGALLVQRLRLERRLAFLGTLGNNAPFVGLLGTVIGIVMAFDRLGEAQLEARAAVMTSIGEALVATAVGLAVAIPAVAGFNYFQRRIKVIATNADALGRVLLAHLVEANDG